MANKRGKTVDTTYLSVTQAEKRGFLHRDYLAHCLRWSHVVSYLLAGAKYKTADVLDVGCGREAPLARMMYSSKMTHTTGSYTGVDYGPIPAEHRIDATKFDANYLERTDFLKAELMDGYEVITSFEVMEHVEPIHAYKMLERMNDLLDENGMAFVSTPCYDPKVGAADNHVNEMTFSAFGTMLELAGFLVSNVYGTFASQKDYKKLMSQEQAEVFNQLSNYYDTNVLSCLMAPMFPAQSRNCLWALRKGTSVGILAPADKKKFLEPSNSNSDDWVTDAEKILKLAKKKA